LKEGAGMDHVPSGTSSPTPPGCAAPCSPTISCAGVLSWVASSTRTS
jgi:hypothetical protein